MRTLLLGDIGNRLDIADAEQEIAAMRVRQSSATQSIRRKEGVIIALRDELAKQRLATTALTRFLIAKGVVDQAELESYVQEVDAEDGLLDGKIPIEVEEGGTLRLRFPKLDK